MKSMTGFGRSSNRSNSRKISQRPTRAKTSTKAIKTELGIDLDISVKSVNGRYLEIRFHMPREYAALESDFKAALSRVFARGTIDVYVNRRMTSAAPEIRVNKVLAKAWADSYRDLAKTLKLSGTPSLELLSRIPEIFQVDDRADLSEAEVNLAKSLMAESATACDQERSREGLSIETDLTALCSKLEKLAEQAEAIKGEAQLELEKRLRDRLEDNLNKRGFDGKVDDQRVAQEVVMYLDRADISEEITRLREHLKAYRQLLKSKESQGKKLDFYAQELLREVNTIGSKSHIAKLTSLVVEAKTCVEKIREQVQNVE